MVAIEDLSSDFFAKLNPTFNAPPLPSSSNNGLPSSWDFSQISVLREVMKEMKNDIVREMELVIQREFSSNFDKVVNVVRDKQPFKPTEIISLDSPRARDKKIEYQFLKQCSRLEQFAANDIQIRLPDTLGEAEVRKEASTIHEESLKEEVLAIPLHGGGTMGRDDVVKVVVDSSPEELQLALEKKLDPNLILRDVKLDEYTKTWTHCSLLALAVMTGQKSHVSLLAHMKASMDSTYGFLAGTAQQDWSGPAMTATLVSNNMPMLKLLLELKADPATEASNGANFIWQCSYFGRDEMLELCLSDAVGVSEKTLRKTAESQNEAGTWYSPFHISVLMGRESCSRLLLVAKARINSKNEQDETPLDIAIHFCHLDLVTLLVQKGARIIERTPVAITSSEESRSDSQQRPSGRSSSGLSNLSSLSLSNIFQLNSAQSRHFQFGGGLKRLFSKRERNTVLVHAVARGLQSQPKQVEMLDTSAILEFWRTDATCMLAILDAMFVERHLRFKGKDGKGVREHKTAILPKSETLKNDHMYKHKIVVSSRYCYDEIVRLEMSGGIPDEYMKEFIRRLTPQKAHDYIVRKSRYSANAYSRRTQTSEEGTDTANTRGSRVSADIGNRVSGRFGVKPERQGCRASCAAKRHHLCYIPISVFECLIPSIHDDLRFLKRLADASSELRTDVMRARRRAAAVDDIFANHHCQAIVKCCWDRTRKFAIMRFCAHAALLVFFIYVALIRNYIRSDEIHSGLQEYGEINLRVRTVALVISPFWLFELFLECIEFVVHVGYGWTWNYLTDVQNYSDMGRISLDGGVVISFIIWGFEPTENIYFRTCFGAVCAVKWTKMLYSLTPFRRVGLSVLPILYTLLSIVPIVAILTFYLAGLAHGMVALDHLPHRFSVTALHSVMFGVSGELEVVDAMNNPDDRNDFQSWWIQLILVILTFGLPITFMNIFIAAMSSNYERLTNQMEVLFESRCAEAGFSQACVDRVFRKLCGNSEDERDYRLWYCRARD